MTKYSIIFCGTPAFAVPSLEALAGNPAFEVKLVITQPDKPVGRTRTMTPPPVKEAAQKLGIPVIQPEDINAFARSLKLEARSFDMLVVVAYGKIFSKKTLSLPRIAAVNVHGSLLPRWRGASPVEHAILAGDAATGVTVQIMAEELDAGPILATARTAIGERATTPQLKEQLCHMGETLLVETLLSPMHPVDQPADGVTYCRKLTRADGEADPLAMTAQTMDRLVRALVPWPGVTCDVQGRKLKLIETSLQPVPRSAPLPCAEGTVLHLVTVQPPGKKPMTGEEWERGALRALKRATAFPATRR